MQEEVTQKTIALVIKTAKLDANVLKAAMRMYLNHRRQKAQKTHGKTSVKKLVGEGVGVSSIEVTDGNIKSFERVARKYNVDFAVKKDNGPAEMWYFSRARMPMQYHRIRTENGAGKRIRTGGRAFE